MYKKKILAALVLISLSLGMLAVAGNASAQGGIVDTITGDEFDTVTESVFDQTGEPTDSLQVIIANIVNAFLGILGVIFIILTIYAGYLWMTAGGNEEQVTRAKKYIANSIIGVIIIIAAYAITYFVINAITGI
ncbi:MAG: hypothetical protein Q8Q23_02775 [bacterium]|nr:hypothetical protein [bacterium]